MSTIDTPSSPTAASVRNDEAYVIDATEFKVKVLNLVQAHKNLIKIANIIYSAPKSQSGIVFPNGKQLGRQNFNAYVTEFGRQLKELPKFFNASKKRRVHRNPDNKSGDQLKAMFYVSDQLVEFLRNANLGDGNPNNLNYQTDAELGRLNYPDINHDKNPQQYMGLILNQNIATSGILTSVLSLYTTVNQIQSQTNGGRIKPDDLMLKYFGLKSNTRYILQGTDLTPNDVPPNVKPDKQDKFRTNLNKLNLSAIQRIKDRDTDISINHTDKRGKQVICYKEQVPGQQDDDYGMSYSMYMVLLNYFRIPNELLGPEWIAALQDPNNTEQAGRLQDYIRGLTTWHKEANKDAKKLVQTNRRRQQANVKKVQQATRVASPSRETQSYIKLQALPSIGV